MRPATGSMRLDDGQLDRRRRRRRRLRRLGRVARPGAARSSRPGGTVVARRHARRHHPRPHRPVAPRDRARAAATPTRARRLRRAPSTSSRELDLGRLVSATYPLAATRTPSPTPPTPAAAARSRSPSTSATEREREPSDAPSRVRPRRRPLDPADPVPPRRGLPAREAAGRPQPRRLPGRAARRRSTTPTAPSATRSQPARRLRPAAARCCTPGMKLTIAFDDISLPLPPMRRPDIRQRVIEAVLDLAAAAGVDDVHLIAALALHRRMTEAELRHAVGDRVYDAFAPHGLLYNHDAEDPDDLAFLGDHRRRARRSRSTSGRPRATCSSTSTSTSCRWTAARSPPPPAWPRTGSCATTTTCSTMQHSRVVHGPAQARELHSLELAHGRGAPQRRRQGLPDRDDAQQRHLRHDGPDVGAAEARVGVDGHATGPRSSA